MMLRSASGTSEGVFHEVAHLFPPMGEEEFQLFVADIEKRGLLEPIWTYQGKIIDGIHRYRACQLLGIEPTYREWKSIGSLVAFVVSCNLHRRHLTTTQKTMIALDIEQQLAIEAKRNMSLGGGDQKSGLEIIPNPIITPLHAAEQAAAAVGTNPRYVTDAKTIVKKAPELKEKMKRGELGIADAKRLAAFSQEQRTAALQMKTEGRVKTVKAAVMCMKKAAIEVQTQADPAKPRLTLASWEHWLPEQPSCDLLLTDPPYSTDVDDIEAFAQTWLPRALARSSQPVEPMSVSEPTPRNSALISMCRRAGPWRRSWSGVTAIPWGQRRSSDISKTGKRSSTFMGRTHHRWIAHC